MEIQKIPRLLALGPIHITTYWLPYPPHWRSGQDLPNFPVSLGEQIKRHRLKLHLLQADVAKALGVSIVTISNWERGIHRPARRRLERIRDFFDASSKLLGVTGHDWEF